MKRGDRVWVEATVERVYRDQLGQEWAGFSVDGSTDVMHVETSLLKPREDAPAKRAKVSYHNKQGEKMTTPVTSR
jgi:hypothetical protein